MAEKVDKSDLGKVISERKSRKKGKTECPGYILQKRTLSTSDKRGSRDIFVNNQTSLKAYMHICEKRFNNGAPDLIIHGLGASVYKASTLALRLVELHHGTLNLDIKTSTVTLQDQLKSISEDLDDEVNNRQNSAIHIRIFRKIPLTSLRITE